ncbi:STAS/SEC14 domain-containing protein [Dyella sp. RRB7]|uniref:STAS/SEC14 domain-containing protein n=1 Tax=Dyella sp. RRB7 TaxID=2919502 RepID=UPI001FA96748|nr:STAS/SEC14 domain-containing protein [Dyella sp. RRB7]
MIEQIEGLPAGTLGFRASGQVTAADYERVLVPDIEAAFVVYRKLRLLYHLGPDFTGFDPGAMWDDAMLGFRHFSGWDRVALVTDVQWLRIAATAMGFAVPAEFRLFRNAELVKAIDWIREPRTEPEDGNT